MTSRQIILQTLFLFLIGCAIGRQGVYLNELATPILKINADTLTVKTGNSGYNSALLVYKINIKVDNRQKAIYLSAEQALKRKSKSIFTIKLKSYKVTDPKSYTYYWCDPDQKTTKLEITN